MASTGFQNVAGLMGLFIAGAWADRWRRSNVRGYIYVTVIGIICAAPGILLVVASPSFAIAMGGLVIYGFCVEVNDATQMPILCQVVDPRYRATAYGTMNFVQQITGGLAIYGTGALRDLKVDTGKVLVVGAVVQVCAACLLLLLKPRRPV
jgi:MFS family permease